MKRLLIAVLLLISTTVIAGENNFSCQFTQGNQYLGGSSVTYKIYTNNQGQITSTYISIPLYAIATGPQTTTQFSYRNTIMTNRDGTIPPNGLLTSAYGVAPGNFVEYRGNEILGVPLGSALLQASFDTLSGRLEVFTGYGKDVNNRYRGHAAFYQCYKAQSLVN